MANEINIKADTKDGLGFTIEALFDGIKGLVSSKTVVGEPVVCGDIKLIPLIEFSTGMASGSINGTKGAKDAGAMSTKISPVAMLVFQHDRVRLISIKNQDVLGKLVELIPEAMDRLTGGTISKEARKKADELMSNMEVVRPERR